MEEIKRIVDLMTADLKRRLSERRISIELTDRARELVARRGFDPVYGARPLKRFLQHEVETRIGREIISGEVMDGSIITVDADGSDLSVKIGEPNQAAISMPGR